MKCKVENGKEEEEEEERCGDLGSDSLVLWEIRNLTYLADNVDISVHVCVCLCVSVCVCVYDYPTYFLRVCKCIC